VAVWLNLTPDHLDRHGDLAGYVAAKEQIFANQGEGDVAVVGIDDAPSQEIAYRLRAQGRKVVTVSIDEAAPAEIEAGTGRLIDTLDGAPIEAIDLRALSNLRGRHNWQNVATAYAVVRALGLSPERAAAGLPSFAGLPHRMEEVARAARVVWVNDSKATNPDSAARSLSSFESIYWIAGGKPKPGGFKSLRPFMGAVRSAYLIGAAADEIAADVGDLVPVRRCGRLDAAVAHASADARASGEAEAVVLLAPACASFDQFKDFEARGDAFRALAIAQAREDAA
jgi:UDP-N-acetylmuramoylalanine--D-glutamate ligase